MEFETTGLMSLIYMILNGTRSRCKITKELIPIGIEGIYMYVESYRLFLQKEKKAFSLVTKHLHLDEKTLSPSVYNINVRFNFRNNHVGYDIIGVIKCARVSEIA